MLRLRILALLVSVTLLLSTAPALANGDEPGYLALGDSVAFGYDPLVSPADRSDPDNFEGYPEALADMLDIGVTNASCPGEASGGFISLTGVDNSCRPYRFVGHYPLHVDYSTSQLDFAVAYLRAHPNTKLITINLGANDLFVLQKQCNFVTACILSELPALLAQLGRNLQTIYAGLKAAGFHGQLLALTYYSRDYRDPTGVTVISLINDVVARATLAAGGRAASGFTAFATASAPFGGDTCAAGLLIRLTATTCDIHPSPKGRDLLAKTIRAVL
jgi:lysophospholipase L1-like esterase